MAIIQFLSFAMANDIYFILDGLDIIDCQTSLGDTLFFKTLFKSKYFFYHIKLEMVWNLCWYDNFFPIQSVLFLYTEFIIY